MNKTLNTIKLWCYCSVTAWNLSGQVDHYKLNEKLICIKCGRGNS